MIDTIVTTVKEFEWTGMMGILLYWVPLAMCAIGYTVRTINNVAEDVKAREVVNDYLSNAPSGMSEDQARTYRINGPFYVPTVTLGNIICRVLATVLPIINLWCALTDVAVIQRFFSFIGAVFDQPLVPPKK